MSHAVISEGSIMDYDAQESRVQNLEKSNTETVSKLNGIDIRLGYIDKSVQSIGDKIDELIHPVMARLDKTDARADEHSKVIGDFTKVAEEKRERWNAIKKFAFAVTVAGGGILGKEIFVFIWHLVTTKA
jgi:hypothetical protein